MVKRNANEVEDSTSRRRTRSSGLLAHMQLTLSPAKKRRKVLPVISTLKSSDGRGSSKENDVKDATCSRNEPSDDELDLLRTPSRNAIASPVSPKQHAAPTWKGTVSPRQVMDAVVITTPKSTLRTPQTYIGRVPGSPSPTRPRKDRSPTRLSSDSCKHMTLQSPQDLLISAPVSSASFSFSPDALSKHVLSSPARPAAIKRLPRPLPSHLVPYLYLQKKEVLNALQQPSLSEHGSSSNSLVFNQLTDLVKGTTERHEGNSCLIIGPRGSGKSRVVNSVLASLASTSSQLPVIVRLSAHCQTNGRLAMREIARQIKKQLGSVPLPTGEDREDSIEVDSTGMGMDLPPSSQLPAVISALPGLGRPVIVVLDAFDGFAAHPRQALLYCLLDTVQSSRGGSPSKTGSHEPINDSTDLLDQQGMERQSREVQHCRDKVSHDDDSVATAIRSEHGLLVIGVTSRVDCLTLLEKRVKSRFSHRILRVGTPSGLDDVFELLSTILHAEGNNESATTQEWKQLWTLSIKNFLTDTDVSNTLKETFAFGKDLRSIFRLLISPVVALTPNRPWLIASHLVTSVSTQRIPTLFPFLPALPYPHVALLIAASHELTAGHDTFNFEMLHDQFVTQVRVSVSAPVHVERGVLGMVNVARGVLMGAFEQLVANRVFQAVAAPSNHITKEYVKYRNTAPREELRAAVEHLGQTNLRKWFLRNQ